MPRTPWDDKTPWESPAEIYLRQRDKDVQYRKSLTATQVAREARQRTSTSRYGGESFPNPTIQQLQAMQENKDQQHREAYGSGAMRGLSNLFEVGNARVTPQPPEGAEYDGGSPWKSALKPFAWTLGKWQQGTEFVAGNLATPFSEQVRDYRSAGLSAGEAWRKAEFATKRFGAEKGEEGFGFNLGVKGAMELIVDPVNWIPLGLVAKPLRTGARFFFDLTPAAKIGKEARRKGLAIDQELRALSLHKLNKKEALETIRKSSGTPEQRRLLRESYDRFGADLDGSSQIRPLDYIYNIENYDSMLESRKINIDSGKGDFLRWINSDEAKNMSWWKGRHLFQALKNVHKKYNPAWNMSATAEGRASLAYLQTRSKIQSSLDAILSPQKGVRTHDDIFDVSNEVLEQSDGILTTRSPVKTVKMHVNQYKTEFRVEDINDAVRKYATDVLGRPDAAGMKTGVLKQVITQVDEKTGELFLLTAKGMPLARMKFLDSVGERSTQKMAEDSGELLGEYFKYLNDVRSASSKNLFQSKKGMNTNTVQLGEGYQSIVGDMEIEIFQTTTADISEKAAINGRSRIKALQRDTRELASIEDQLLDATKESERILRDSYGQLITSISKRIDDLIDETFDQKWYRSDVPGSGAFDFNMERFSDFSGTSSKIDSLARWNDTTNLDEVSAQLAEMKKQFIPGRFGGTRKGQTRAQGVMKTPIFDATSASNYVDSLAEALSPKIGSPKITFSTSSPKQVDEIGELLGFKAVDRASKAGQAAAIRQKTLETAIKRNIFKRLEQLSKKQGNRFSNKNPDFITFKGKNGKRKFLAKHEAYEGKKLTYENLKGMGILTEKQLEKFKGFGLKAGIDEVVMPFADMLDLGGYVLGYSDLTGKPIRLYDHYFDLTKEQRNWMANYYGYFDEGAALLRYHNLPPDNILEFKTTNYVHHATEAWADVDGTVGEQNVASIFGDTLGDPAYKYDRIHETISEAMERGVNYQQNPMAVAESFLDQVYRHIADETYTKRLTNVAHAQMKGAEKRISSYKKKVEKINEATRQIRKATLSKYHHIRPETFLRSIDEDFSGFVDSHVSEELKEQLGKIIDTSPETGITDDGYKEADGLVRDFLERVEESAKAKTDADRAIVKQIQSGEIKIPDETVKRWGGMVGEEAATVRLARDGRNNFERNVQTLQEQALFFKPETAKLIEKTLNVEQRNWMDSILDGASNISDHLRLLQTGFDAGTTFLHGLPALMRGLATANTDTGRQYLSAWSDANKGMWKAIINTSSGKNNARALHMQMIGDNAAEFKLMAEHGVLLSGAGSDFYRARDNTGTLNRLINEGRFSERQAMDSMPGAVRGPIKKVGKVADHMLTNFQSGFEVFGDIQRHGLWRAHYDQIMMSTASNEVKSQQLFQLGEYINGMTGAFSSTRAALGVRQQAFERSVLFFSPSYTRASIGLMGSVYNGDLQGELAKKAMASILGVGVLSHLGLATAKAEAEGESFDKYWKLDPTNGDFLTLDVGGVRVGIGSIWMSSARTLAKVAADPAFRGDILDSPLLLSGSGAGQAGFDSQGIKDAIDNNQVLYWLRSRSSPVGGTMWDIAMGADFIGEEIKPTPYGWGWIKHLGSNALPFWMDAAWEQSNVITGVAAGAAEFTGVRSVPIQDWELLKEQRNMVSQQFYQKPYRELNKVQKQILVKDVGPTGIEIDPNVQRLVELEMLVGERRRKVGGSELVEEMDNFQDEREDIRHAYLDEVQDAQAKASQGIYTLDEWRRVEARARNVYGVQRRQLNEKYVKVTDYYDAIKDTKGEDTERPEDFAADQYLDIYWDPKWDLEFMYDFQGREQALEEWRSIWGEDYEQYAREMVFSQRWDSSPLNEELFPSRDRMMKKYWEETRKIIFQGWFQGQLDGVYDEWYRAKYDPILRKSIEENVPDFKRALKNWEELRKEYRKVDVELDAFLYRWGYTDKLVNPVNSGREVELKSTFPFEEYTPQQRVAGQ